QGVRAGDRTARPRAPARLRPEPEAGAELRPPPDPYAGHRPPADLAALPRSPRVHVPDGVPRLLHPRLDVRPRPDRPGHRPRPRRSAPGVVRPAWPARRAPGPEHAGHRPRGRPRHPGASEAELDGAREGGRG